jgi:hypothetical protein
VSRQWSSQSVWAAKTLTVGRDTGVRQASRFSGAFKITRGVRFTKHMQYSHALERSGAGGLHAKPLDQRILRFLSEAKRTKFKSL